MSSLPVPVSLDSTLRQVEASGLLPHGVGDGRPDWTAPSDSRRAPTRLKRT